MKRQTLVAAVAALAVPVLAVSASTAAAKTTRHVSLTIVGAQVAPNEAVYVVRGTRRGALIQVFKTNSANTGATSTSTFYDGHGTITGRQTSTLSQPDANGIITITASGRFVSGTGKYKGAVGKLTVTGTLNTQTRVFNLTATGTETY